MSRLIDANALMEEINGFGMTVTGLRAGKGVLLEYAKHYRDSINRIIDDAPTVDAVPVVHGRWIEAKDGYFTSGGNPVFTCSICSHNMVDYRIYHWQKTPSQNYCSNCGAKMDLEVDGDG